MLEWLGSEQGISVQIESNHRRLMTEPFDDSRSSLKSTPGVVIGAIIMSGRNLMMMNHFLLPTEEKGKFSTPIQRITAKNFLGQNKLLL